jgi:hypothetical protein
MHDPDPQGTVVEEAWLFSYGTLQLREVQVATFGRPLVGVEDAIVGYRMEWLRIADAQVVATSGTAVHPVLRWTGGARDEIPGLRFQISQHDLAAADRYEVDDYARVEVELRSGLVAWVYVLGETAESGSPSRGLDR